MLCEVTRDQPRRLIAMGLWGPGFLLIACIAAADTGHAAQGLFLVTVDGTGAWWTIFSPVIVTVLLLRVSGIPILDANDDCAWREVAGRDSVAAHDHHD